MMRRLGILLSHILRHAAVGVAVAAVLMTAFDVHLHADAADGHDHGDDCRVAWVLDDEVPQQADPDNCGSCHCPSPAIGVPDLPAMAVPSLGHALERPGHPAAAPDGLSYPPDPPPVRLG